MKVYLCGPIDLCTNKEARVWREAVKTYFPLAIDPMSRDYTGKLATSYREIVELDKRDIRDADAVLVNFFVPSVGTMMEVIYAWTVGVPVVVWMTADVPISPWLRYHAMTIVHSLHEAVSTLRMIGKRRV